MVSLAPGYARLDIAAEEEFAEVSQSIRTLFDLCRESGLPGALIASEQDGYDWRSSLRVGVRFAASRGTVPGMRLALLIRHFNDSAADEVCKAARQVGLDCEVFRAEAKALAWLNAGAAPG